MEPIVDRSEAQADVLLSFFMPHAMLEIPRPTDTRATRRDKTARNKAWLMRWLPVYMLRWSLLFAGTVVVNWMAAELGMPSFITWAGDLIQCACAGMATFCIGLYLHIRFGSK